MIILSDIQYIFNRAISLTFSKWKCLFVFCILLLCGLLEVFFRGFAIYANRWVMMSLTFMPIFLSAGILLSSGVVLIRIYHDEVKKRAISYSKILANSWEVMIGASYFSIPIILCYLLLWMLLGIFVLLREIPGVGDLFAVFLAFGPFLLNFGSIILCLLNLSLLFYVTPIIALHGMNRMRLAQILVQRLQEDLFSNILLGVISALPLVFVIGLLSLSTLLTETVFIPVNDPLHVIIQWFFIMIPVTAILAPAVVFFFNFAAESHVLLRKKLREEEKMVVSVENS